MPHPLGSGPAAQERLDALLMALAFELEVRVAFLGRGVWQLAAGQAGRDGDPPPFTAGYRSLELYGVAGVLVEAESMSEAGLTPEDLIMPVEVVSRVELRGLMAAQDVLL